MNTKKGEQITTSQILVHDEICRELEYVKPAKSSEKKRWNERRHSFTARITFENNLYIVVARWAEWWCGIEASVSYTRNYKRISLEEIEAIPGDSLWTITA